MTVAPGIDDPDLSTTFPEKLPTAWPYRAGENISAKTQTTRRNRTLWGFLPVEPSTDLGHVIPTMVRIIGNPFDKRRVVLALTELRWIRFIDCKKGPVESQRKFCGPKNSSAFLISFRRKKLAELPIGPHFRAVFALILLRSKEAT